MYATKRLQATNHSEILCNDCWSHQEPMHSVNKGAQAQTPITRGDTQTVTGGRDDKTVTIIQYATGICGKDHKYVIKHRNHYATLNMLERLKLSLEAGITKQ